MRIPGFDRASAKPEKVSHQQKKKQNQQLLDQIKILEAKIKEKKRQREKLIDSCHESESQLQKQKDLRQRIVEFESSTAKTHETISQSFFQSSIDDENDIKTNQVSISAHQNSAQRASAFHNSAMQTSNHESLDVKHNTSQVHNIYQKLIGNDLETAKRRTENQLELERQQAELVNRSIKELKDENKAL